MRNSFNRSCNSAGIREQSVPNGACSWQNSFGQRGDVVLGAHLVQPANINGLARVIGVRATLMVDHFATLGVRGNASKSEIKSAYRNLAKQYHPDVCRGDQCQTMFVQISTAYEHALNCITGPNFYASDRKCGDDNFSEECSEELEDWEEWMGWEGAGTLDYFSHMSYEVSSY